MIGSAFSCTGVFAITSESKKFSLRYIFGLLNSNSASVLDALPIKVACLHRDIEALVDQIFAAKKKVANADISDLEKQKVQRVYAHYSLTSEEIAIVEGGLGK